MTSWFVVLGQSVKVVENGLVPYHASPQSGTWPRSLSSNIVLDASLVIECKQQFRPCVNTPTEGEEFLKALLCFFFANPANRLCHVHYE